MTVAQVKVFALAMLAACGVQGQMNLRYLSVTTALEQASVADSTPLRWYQGEKVTFDHWSTWRGSAAVWTNYSNLVAIWSLTGNRVENPDDTNTYLWVTGAVTAAGGKVRFTAAPEYTAAPASNYWSFVTLYQTDPAGLTNQEIGVLHRAKAVIGFRDTHPQYAGPWQLPSNMVDGVARAWASNASNTAAAAYSLASSALQPSATNGLVTAAVTNGLLATNGSGSGLTGVWKTNDLPWTLEGYTSTNPGYVWNGAQQVSTNAWTATLGGLAVFQDGKYAIVPYTNVRHDVTGTVTIVSSRYIVHVSMDWSYGSVGTTGLLIPVNQESKRLSPTSWIVRAWCTTDPYMFSTHYWGYASNVTVWTYDRIMDPLQYTNDAAGIVARADGLPGADGTDVTTDPRRVVNADSLKRYIDSRKEEIADHAYNRTPGGRSNPNSSIFTVDEPLVQQGAISFLNSGDYIVFSYIGGDWFNSTTGSTWRIGPSGRTAFEINSTNRMLHIQAFYVANGYATLDISTNWVVGTPSIEFCNDLANPQWLTCPAQTMTNMTSYWRGVCPTGTNSSRFFRAVSPGGENMIRSHFRHEFLDGITIGGTTFTNLTQLKALLEALP